MAKRTRANCPACGRVAKRKKCDACGFVRERWGLSPIDVARTARVARTDAQPALILARRRLAASNAEGRLLADAYAPGPDAIPGMTEAQQDAAIKPTQQPNYDYEHTCVDARNGVTRACRRDDLWLLENWGPRKTDEEVLDNP